MNSDIRLATNFFDHPKTLALIEVCGPQGVICLLRLWIWAATTRPRGDLSGIPDSKLVAVSDSAEIPGFLEALTSVGFVDGKPLRRALHDWLDWQGYVAGAERRRMRAVKANAARWDNAESKKPENSTTNARRIVLPASSYMHDPPSPSPSPSPSPVPSLSPVLEAEILARNERIMREAEPQPVRFSLECLAGQIAQFTDADLKLWSEAYPAVNVPEALNRARAWIEANPERRKTLKGAKRYLNSWLSREQNSGGDRKPLNRPSPMDAIKRRFLEGKS